jgi:hypothetical protein
MAGGDQGAALLARLDDDNYLAQARDDSIPRREPPRKRLLSQVILGDDSPCVLYLLKEAAIGLWVDYIDPTAQHPDGGSATLQRSLMRRRVYAEG